MVALGLFEDEIGDLEKRVGTAAQFDLAGERFDAFFFGEEIDFEFGQLDGRGRRPVSAALRAATAAEAASITATAWTAGSTFATPVALGTSAETAGALSAEAARAAGATTLGKIGRAHV